MARYFESVWSGKGYITHDDRKTMDFAQQGNLVEVSGDDEAISGWAARVGAKELTEKSYANQKLTLEKQALENEIAQLTAEKTGKEAELSIVSTKLTKEVK